MEYWLIIFVCMKNKPRLSKILMIASIVLIAVFQGYWIAKLYKEERASLQKEADLLFRDVVYKLQLQRLKSDTTFIKHGLPDNLFAFDVLKEMKQNAFDSVQTKNLKGDTTQKHLFISMNVQRQGDDAGFITGREDPFNLPVLPSGRPGMVTIIADGKNILDSLPLNKIDSAYKAELLKNNINLHYTLKRMVGRPARAIQQKIDPGKISTNFAFVGLSRPVAYKAEFDKPFFYLAGKLSLPVILSLLLIVLTLISFIFLYRNLIAQQRLSAVKNEFISNITHELKTPIATVNVAIEALRNFNALDDPAKTKEYLDISASELQRLSLLVDKVLRLSMFESREIELNKETFSLKELAEEVISIMRLQFDKQDAIVSLKTEGENFTVTADRTHMTSVLYNLLDNTLKYKKENPHIEVILKSHAMHVEVKIKDNGIGIPPEYRWRVFEKFFRVPTDSVHNTKGYGLGLSYVNHILHRHMGFIELDSQPGIGSVFTAHIPYKEADVIWFDNKRKMMKKAIFIGRKKS